MRRAVGPAAPRPSRSGGRARAGKWRTRASFSSRTNPATSMPMRWWSTAGWPSGSSAHRQSFEVEERFMKFDLVIRDGEVHDGLANPPRRADIGIVDGLIHTIGNIEGQGAREIDAGGCLVTPGFVDIHTHYDGQATWDNRLSPSSFHGVTTVVMGNCGVGFAPVREGDRNTLIEVM